MGTRILLLLLTFTHCCFGGADWSAFNIAFVGDSLTARNAAGVDGGAGNPSGKLAAAHPTATIFNDATSGWRVSHLVADAATTDAHLHGSKTNILICLVGSNDMFAGAGANDTYTALLAYLDARKTAGWRIYPLTIPSYDPVFEVNSQPGFITDYNTAIVAGYAAKGYHLINLGGVAPFNDYTMLGGGDGIHFGDTTITAYTNLVEAKLEADFGVSTATPGKRGGRAGGGAAVLRGLLR